MRTRAAGAVRNHRPQPPLHILEALYSFNFWGSESVGFRLCVEMRKAGVQVSAASIFLGDGPIRSALATHEIAGHIIGYQTHSRLMRLLIDLRFALILKRTKVNVIHAHHISVFIRCLRPAKWAGVARVVLTEHAKDYVSETPRLKKNARKKLPRANLVTVIHMGLRDFFVDDLNVDADKVVLIPNGVDTSIFVPSDKDEVQPDAKRQLRLGFVGRLHVDKNVPNLLRAFKFFVDSENCEAELLLAGDGPERHSLEQLTKKLGIESRTVFLGVQQDVARFLRSIDVMILPSTTEGVPLVILEALSAETPVIATDVGGVRFIMNDQVGRLVPSDDSGALCDAIKELAADPKLRRSLGSAGRRMVCEHYELKSIAKTYLYHLTSGVNVAS